MWNAKIAARKETGKWRTPNPVPEREGGGEAPQTRSGDPGAAENAPPSTHPAPWARAFREEPTVARPRAVSAARPPSRGGLPSPTPAQGNGAGRLRAGKAFGQSGLRQRPIPRVPKANRHSSGRFPSARPPVRPRRRMAGFRCGAFGLAMPFPRTH